MSNAAINPCHAIRLLGVEVHPCAWPILEDAIVAAVAARSRCVIANHNLHSVYLYHHDAAFRSFYDNATVIHIDGMSLVILGKMLGLRVQRAHRLTPLDWIRPLLAEAARRRWRVFYLGSRPGVAARGTARLGEEFPGLDLETAHGYFDARRGSKENKAVIDAINRVRPDLLFVGMGMPRQERWILENLADLDAGAIFNVGSLMDYLAGETATPPRWVGRTGLEWLFRLMGDPQRLGRRYLVEPWFVVKLLLHDLRRWRKGG